MAEAFFDFDFGTGVASGLLAAFLLWVAGQLWVHRWAPQLRRWAYRGVNISGEWKGAGAGFTPAHGEWSELVLRLHQDVCEVRGLVVLRCRSSGQAFDVTLHARGTVSEGYVALGLSPAGESLPTPATALLKIEARGAALNGQLLYRHPFLDIVDVIDTCLERTQPALSPAARAAGAVPSDAGPAEATGMGAGTVLD